jgi:hypothetical protein
VITCEVTPIIGHVDVTVAVSVMLSGAPGLQVHEKLEYTVDTLLPGTEATVFVMPSAQIPSLTGPPGPNCISQVAGLVLATLIAIGAVAPRDTAVVGATTFVNEPVSPLESKVQVAMLPAGTGPVLLPLSPMIGGGPTAAVIIEYAFFSVLPHATLLVK